MNVKEILKELGFSEVWNKTLGQRLKFITHLKYIGVDGERKTYIYYSTVKRKFHIAEQYRSWANMDIENIVPIPKDFKTKEDIENLVKTLS